MNTTVEKSEPNTDQAPGNRLGPCLVTGAAGFVGRHLVEALLEHGCKVRALVRNTPLALQHPNLQCISGDIQNATQMSQACEGVETVFHVAAHIALLGGSGATARYRDQAYAINVSGTYTKAELYRLRSDGSRSSTFSQWYLKEDEEHYVEKVQSILKTLLVE